MRATIKVKKEVEIKTLHVEAGVRYWEDATVNGVEDEDGELIPCRDGDYWKPIIDVDNGIITNWKKGITADIHYKVCDDGTYYLKDAEGNTVLTKEGYVPDILAIGDKGYGDYLIINVDEDGKILDWEFDTDDFDEDDE